MSRAARLATTAVALAGCATFAVPEAPPAARGVPPPVANGPPAQAFAESDLPDDDSDASPEPRFGESPGASDLPERLAARARSLLGRRGPFEAGGERFNGDCSGFVQAVYAAEGISLRGLMQRAAPDERGAVKAAWAAARENGGALGADGWPRPGDLVFWGDTYDRNRNGRVDDPLTHIGIVEYVDDGTVYFLHRGGRGVARGVMTPGRSHEARDPDGRPVNSTLRARSHPVKDGGLAAELLEGYGRIEPGSVPAQYARGRRDHSPAPPEDGEAGAEDGAAGGSARRERSADPTASYGGTPTTNDTPLPPPTSTPSPPPPPISPRPAAAVKTTRAAQRPPLVNAKASPKTRPIAKAHPGARTRKKALASAKPHRKKVAKRGSARSSSRSGKGPARTASRSVR